MHCGAVCLQGPGGGPQGFFFGPQIWGICVAVCCSALQCTSNIFAVCFSVTQCVAVRCSAMQCVAVRCSAMQCVAVRCSAMQCVAVCCSAMQCVAVHLRYSDCALQYVLQCVEVRCSALQRVAARCIALQYVAVHLMYPYCILQGVVMCCSVLHRVAVRHSMLQCTSGILVVSNTTLPLHYHCITTSLHIETCHKHMNESRIHPRTDFP